MNLKKSGLKPVLSLIMGSRSDWPVMQKALPVLEEFKVSYEALVVSAHRTPQKMQDYALNCHKRGIKVIIAGAGRGRASARYGGLSHSPASYWCAHNEQNP